MRRAPSIGCGCMLRLHSPSKTGVNALMVGSRLGSRDDAECLIELPRLVPTQGRDK
jgi:hypothetical protein